MDIPNKKISSDKEFRVRNSLLTDLSENKHIRTIYNLFLAIFVGLCINTSVHTYIKNNEISLGLKLIKIGFAKFDIVILTWISYMILTCSVFPVFKIWSQYRKFPKLSQTKLWDRAFLILTILYYFGTLKLAATIVTSFQLPIGSASVVIVEQIRLLMKVHSFIRTKAGKTLKIKPQEDEEPLPGFWHFFSFLFFPTLLYRDSYPRKDKTDWIFVLFRFLECIGGIFFLSFVGDKLLTPSLEDFGLRKYTIRELVVILFENTITGIFILLAFFIIILHSCQNMFAEITRFADRMFYSDWWTCTDYGDFLRKWNIIVQEWLFVYVYREFSETFGTSTNVAKFAVLLFSAIFHEWCLYYALGFFFPLLFIEFFVFGQLLTFVRKLKNSVFNALFWYSLALGMGSIVTMYSVEYYARTNIPEVNPTFVGSLIPRFLTCDCIER